MLKSAKKITNPNLLLNIFHHNPFVYTYFYNMIPLSIVLVVKNESKHIVKCLNACNGITDNIVVIDSGSTDNTVLLSKQCGADVYEIKWEGFSKTKNQANSFAKYDWILSLDADEVMNDTLKNSIINLFSNPLPENTIATLKRKTVYGNKVLHFGASFNEYRKRIFNRKNTSWNNQEVHEDLVAQHTDSIIKLDGFLKHYSIENEVQHSAQLEKYAQLSAIQMKKMGKQYSQLRTFVSPFFSFVKNYFFRLGFIDGYYGFLFAKGNAWYTKRKYELLKE